MTDIVSGLENPSDWGSMPGWNIIADLTPPELIYARRLAVIRRRIVAMLVIVVLLCGAGYAYAARQHGSASDVAVGASAQTTDLARAAAKYAGVTRLESAVDAVRGQVATVMQNDVDVARTIAAVRAALPSSMSIQSLTVTITPVAAGATSGAGGLDASGHAQIGTVSISGSGRSLDALPGFVDRLVAIRGVVNVLPSSNVVSGTTAQYSLTFSLTDVLYSHQYDVANTGGR